MRYSLRIYYCMAKIFRTEKLSLGGNIQLSASGTGEFELLNSTGSTLMSKAGIESDISSLQAQRNVDEGTTDSDVSSLAGDIATNKGDLESDVSSLAGVAAGSTGELESDVSSLATLIADNDVVAKSSSVTNGASDSGSIAFDRTFASTPVVVALLKSSNANDPIIACMVSAVSTTSATVTFADQVPSSDYTVELIASIAG